LKRDCQKLPPLWQSGLIIRKKNIR